MAIAATLVVDLKLRAVKYLEGIKKAQAKTKTFKNQIRKTKGDLVSFANSSLFAAKALTVLGTAFAIKEAVAFETAMTEVTTLLKDTSEVEAMSAAIKKMSVQFGQMPTDQIKATYQIISAGAISGARAIEILTAANKLAVGGVTSVEIAADGLTSILNAYGTAVKSATDVSDTLFVAMRVGKTTIEELSQSLGIVAPIAAEAGVSFQELTGALAAVTKGGVRTKVAVTGLRQIMVSIIKPGKQAADLAAAIGLEFNVAALRSKGFSGFLKDVIDKTKGSTEALALLFGAVEALTPVLQLAGSQSDSFQEILKQMETRTGETELAVSKMSQTTQFQFNQLKATTVNMATALGDLLLPALNSVMMMMSDAVLKPTGGLNLLEEGFFMAGKSAAALAETTTKLGIALVTVARINPTTGIALLFTDKDEKLLAKLKTNLQSIQDFGTGVEVNRDKLIKHRAAVKADAEALLSLGDANDKVKDKIKLTSVTLEELLKGQEEGGVDHSVTKIQSIIDVLEKQQATLGMTSAQIKSYELSLLGADEATIQLAADLAASIEGFEQQEDALKKVEKANDRARASQVAFDDELTRLANNILTELKTPLDDYNDALALHDQLLKAGKLSAIEWAKANKNAVKELEEATVAAKETNDIASQLGFTFESAFENAIIKGERFRDVLGGIFQDIQRILLRKAIIEPLGKFISGGFDKLFGGATATPLAHGGLATAGHPYLVGERGPELFLPNNTGKVIPNNRSFGSQNINITNYFQISDASEDGLSPIILAKVSRQLEMSIRKIAQREILDSQRNNGLAS